MNAVETSSAGNGSFSIVANPASPGIQAATGKLITSAMITTQAAFSFRYGYAEIRAKLPTALGCWPAFWLLPSVSTATNLGRLPEIDVMEAYGDRPGRYNTTQHTTKSVRTITSLTASGSVATATVQEGTAGLSVGELITIRGASPGVFNVQLVAIIAILNETQFTYALASAPGVNATGSSIKLVEEAAYGENPKIANASDWNTFGLWWDENVIIWYLNDQVVMWQQNTTVFENMYILLNLAISSYAGSWSGVTNFPQKFEIEHLKVFSIS